MKKPKTELEPVSKEPKLVDPEPTKDAQKSTKAKTLSPPVPKDEPKKVIRETKTTPVTKPEKESADQEPMAEVSSERESGKTTDLKTSSREKTKKDKPSGPLQVKALEPKARASTYMGPQALTKTGSLFEHAK